MFFLLSVQILFVVLIVLLVLVQSSGSEGMGGLSSGFGSGGNPFMSSKVVSVFLVKATVVVGVLFMLSTIVLGVYQMQKASVISSGLINKNNVQKVVEKTVDSEDISSYTKAADKSDITNDTKNL